MEPIIWLIILAVLLAIEALTAGLTTIWFAGGALISAIASYFGASIMVQLVLFLAVSLILLFFTRPLAIRYMNQGVEKTNVNSLIGKKAVVLQEVNDLAQTGLVRINDIEWMARAEKENLTIPKDAVVIVRKVQGVKLIVEEVKED